MTYQNPPTTPRKSATFDDYTLSEIRRAAVTGIYDIRGGGAKRKLPHFDDLLFLGASISPMISSSVIGAVSRTRAPGGAAETTSTGTSEPA